MTNESTSIGTADGAFGYFLQAEGRTRRLTSAEDASGIIAEPSRAEPSRAEPSRAEPSRAEPSRAEPSRAEPSRAEPSRAEPSRAEPSRAEPSRAEPSRAEPSRAEPSRAEPSRAEPSRAEPSRAEPSRAEPSFRVVPLGLVPTPFPNLPFTQAGATHLAVLPRLFTSSTLSPPAPARAAVLPSTVRGTALRLLSTAQTHPVMPAKAPISSSPIALLKVMAAIGSARPTVCLPPSRTSRTPR